MKIFRRKSKVRKVSDGKEVKKREDEAGKSFKNKEGWFFIPLFEDV